MAFATKFSNLRPKFYKIRHTKVQKAKYHLKNKKGDEIRNFDRLVTFYLLRAVLYDGLFDKVYGRVADRAIDGLGYKEEQIKAIGGMSNFLKELKQRHDDILKNMPKFPAVLDKNLQILSEKIKLDEMQNQILGFLIVVTN